MLSSTVPASFLVAALLLAAPLAGLPAADAASATAPIARMAETDEVTWSVEASATSAGPRAAFEYAVDPGTQINDTVVIINSGLTPADFRVYATDAINDFETGGLGLLAAGEKPDDLGSWITLDVAELHLEPGTQATVPFTALIPSDASPGDHAAGIIASSLTTGENDGQAVVLDQRVGARVNLRVSGPIAVDLETSGLVAGFTPSWNPFAPGWVAVDYAVKNTGNLRIDVTQTIDVSGPFGIHLGQVKPDAIENLLPGQSVHITREMPAIAALALFWSTVDLVPGPVGSAAAPSADPAATAGAETPAPESGADPVDGPVAEIDFPPASATTLSAAISWTFLALVIVILLAAFLIRRYVSNTRERMYDAIDQAAAEARAEAVREAEENRAEENRAEENRADENRADERARDEVSTR